MPTADVDGSWLRDGSSGGGGHSILKTLSVPGIHTHWHPLPPFVHRNAITSAPLITPSIYLMLSNG